MSKHTGKAMRSSGATPGSKHTARAMNRTSGFAGLPKSKHTGKAVASTRSGATRRASDIAKANKRRNFSGVPKTR